MYTGLLIPQIAPCSAGNSPARFPWRGNSLVPAPIADMGRSRLARSTLSVICLNEDKLLIDERLICEIVKKKLVVRCLKYRHLQHQDRYQLFLRINKKRCSPDSPPSEFAGFS